MHTHIYQPLSRVTRIGWYRNVKLLWILLQKEMMVVQPEL